MDNQEKEKAVAPEWGYVLVWVSLVSLLVLNIFAARVFTGPYKVLTITASASLQAYLIVDWFMGLKDESALFRLVFRVSVATLAVVFWLFFTDVAYRS